MGFQLGEYVLNYLKRGVGKKELYEYLTRVGYSPDDINRAFSYARGVLQPQGTQEVYTNPNSVREKLTDYVRRMLFQGYTPANIRNALLSYGYGQPVIDDVMGKIVGAGAELNGPTIRVRHTIHLSAPLIAIILLIIAALPTSFLLYRHYTKQPAYLLDLSTAPFKDRVKPGDVLNFEIQLLNLGSSKRIDVKLNHYLKNMDGRIIALKKETAALETRLTLKSSFRIPEDIGPGIYTVETVAILPQGKAESSFSFKVYQMSLMPSCVDGIKNNGEEGIDCGGPCAPCKNKTAAPTKPPEEKVKEKELKEIKPVNRPLTPGEAEKEAEEILKNESPEKAVSVCKSITEDYYYTRCINKVAAFANDTSYCSLLSNAPDRDSCLMKIAINGNADACLKITNGMIRHSCISMHRIAIISRLAEENKTDELAEILGIKKKEEKVVTNSPPAIFPIYPQFLKKGETLFYMVRARDYDNDRLVFSDNTTLFDIDKYSGLIKFTPEKRGSYDVKITVSDGKAEDSTPMKIVVR